MAAAKKIKAEDVLDVYKSAYKIQIPWKSVFSDNIDEWMTIYEKATNCSKTLITSSLLSMVAVLCGTSTDIKVEGSGFKSVLNQYIMAICAPGGGKSNTFFRVIEPVIEKMKNKHGISLKLETYTTAGLQKHQIDNQGYGLITGDEGHRFLSSVNFKQSKGESERSLLCTMWGGKGDHSTLVTGTRGFEKTSMSCCLFIQPHPLINEMIQLGGEDGLLDRFMFFAARPVFNPTSITKEFLPKLQSSRVHDFVDIMVQIYEDHVKGMHYTLSSDAETIFDGLIDSYSEFINSKYGSDHDDDKENEQPNDSQNETFRPTITSKDTTHVLRLATILHIINHYLTCALNGHNVPVPTEITDICMKQAMVLYNALAQQKAVFVQAIDSLEKQVATVRVRPSLSFRERVMRAICKAKGPFVPLRYIQQHLKGSLSQNIKIELEFLEKKGFGLLKTIRARSGTRDIFWKIHPNCIDGEIGDHFSMLKSIAISSENYASAFNDMTNITEEMRAFLMENHPQAEMIDALW